MYRGKIKGRNCFIIYVESKHKYIEVHRREQSTLPNLFMRISELSNDEHYSVEERIKHILNFITTSLQISEAVLLFTNKTTIVSGDGYNCNIDDECINIFDKLTANDGLFIPTGLINFSSDSKISKFIDDKKIITFMVSRIIIDKKVFGYLVLFEDKITRIWQEKEVSLLLYMNKIIEILYK